METWQRSELTDVTAKVVIYEAFVEGKLEAPKHLALTVHDLYLEPKYEDSDRERSGVFPTRSRQHSKNWIPFHNSRPRPSWVNSWKPGSRNRSSLRGGLGQPRPFQPNVARRIDALPNDVPEARLWITSGWPTILKMMAISPSLDTFGLRDLVVYFCARANVALTAPP